jgi:hypothetical protein
VLLCCITSLDLLDSVVCNGWHLTTLPLTCSFASDTTRTCIERCSCGQHVLFPSPPSHLSRSYHTSISIHSCGLAASWCAPRPCRGCHARNKKTQAAKRTRIIVSRSQTRRHGSHWSSNQALLHTPHMHTPRHFHRFRRPSSRTVLRLHIFSLTERQGHTSAHDSNLDI